jgi:hypothetical protein
MGIDDKTIQAISRPSNMANNSEMFDQALAAIRAGSDGAVGRQSKPVCAVILK